MKKINKNKHTKNKEDLFKTIYLYVFSVIGLGLLVIGSVGFTNLILKLTIFKQAGTDYSEYYMSLPVMPCNIDNMVEKFQSINTSSDFSDLEKELIKSWIQDYQKWKENYSELDYKKAQNEKTAAQSLALILVGLPLYLYHWRLIRKA